MSQLRIRLLGSFEAKFSEKASPLRFPTRKIKLFLSYLLLNRQKRFLRDQLANLWWGDRETYKARHCLNTALWRLRQTLEGGQPAASLPFVITENDEVYFNAESSYWLDVDEFEK